MVVGHRRHISLPACTRTRVAGANRPHSRMMLLPATLVVLAIVQVSSVVLRFGLMPPASGFLLCILGPVHDDTIIKLHTRNFLLKTADFVKWYTLNSRQTIVVRRLRAIFNFYVS